MTVPPPDSEELQKDLYALVKKYNIDRGIFLFDQFTTKKRDEKRHRVLLFDPDANNPFKSTIFAELLIRCIEISTTLQTILNTVNAISLQKLAEDIHTSQKLSSSTEDIKDIN